MNPADWDAWTKALLGVGTLLAAAEVRVKAISGWFRRRKEERAKRATEQAEARKTLRVLTETIELHEARKAADAEIIAGLRQTVSDQERQIDRLYGRISHLETLLDGARE